MAWNKRTIVKFVLDIVVLLAAGIPVLLYHLFGKPNERGYFCDDESIRYPFKKSTITSNVLYVVGIFLPVIVIIITEFVNASTANNGKPGKVFVLFGFPLSRTALLRIYGRVGVFLFGACISQLTTDIAKYEIGRLRPHFLHQCKPSSQCSLLTDANAYIEHAGCTGTASQVKAARLSFPSGHSSFSAYTMVYTVMYLQANMKCDISRLLKPFLQFLLLMMTWFTALSRVTDYKHHWSDVLAGFLQGTIVSVLIAYFVSDIFTKEIEKPKDKSLEDVAEDTAANFNSIAMHRNVENE